MDSHTFKTMLVWNSNLDGATGNKGKGENFNSSYITVPLPVPVTLWLKILLYRIQVCRCIKTSSFHFHIHSLCRSFEPLGRRDDPEVASALLSLLPSHFSGRRWCRERDCRGRLSKPTYFFWGWPFCLFCLCFVLPSSFPLLRKTRIQRKTRQVKQTLQWLWVAIGLLDGRQRV